jgi:leucyl/phenylalanyl-tRNA--protein transferase
VEVWDEDELIGGLYGLALGKIFYGESMFAKRSNASKIAFVNLVNILRSKDYKLIDCQQETNHLASFGAELISAEKFLNTLRSNIFADHSAKKWNLKS